MGSSNKMEQVDLTDRQAAIDALKERRALYCDNTPDTFSKLSYAEKSRVDELDTAIATLVNLPSAQPMMTKRSDLINRDDAIWAVYKRIKQLGMENNADVLSIRQSIRDLPSAQPEFIAQGAYVRGFEQGRTQGRLDAKLKPICNQLATDTISRQAAIDAALDVVDEWEGGWDIEWGIRDAIKALPSAQPEIIRCKDCKHCKTRIDCIGGEYNGCEVWTGYESEVEPDWFCNFAERREDV